MQVPGKYEWFLTKKGPSTEGKVGIEKSGLQLLYVCNMKRRLVIWTFGNWMFCNWTFVTGRLVTERFVGGPKMYYLCFQTFKCIVFRL